MASIPNFDVVNELFAWAVRTSIATSLVIVLVLAIHAAFGRQLNARVRYALWALVAVRALAPALPQTAWSVFNFTPGFVGQQSSSPDGALAVADALFRPIVVRVDATGQPPLGDFAPTAERRTSPGPNPLALAWLAGCALIGGTAAVSALAFSRRLRRGQHVDEPRVMDALEQCRRSMGLTSVPPVLVVPGVPGPALAGVLRPRIVVPPGLLESLDDAELRCVLAHELAHLGRRDLFAEWVLVLTRTVHWFNPLVWYAAARCRADREVACDEAVLRRAAGADRRCYGRTILKLAEGMPLFPRATAGAVGILAGGAHLKRRIRMIASFRPAPASRWPAALAIVLALLLASCTMTDRRRSGPPGGGAGAGAGASGKPEPADEFGRVTRVYDVHDLLIHVPDFTEAPRFLDEAKGTDGNEKPSPATEPSDVTRERLMAQLTELLKDTATSEEWERPGGNVVRETAGQLILTAKPAAHAQVQDLFAHLREARAVQITIESRFIAVDDETLAKLNGELAALVQGDLAPTAPGQPTRHAATFLNDAKLQSLLRAVQAGKGTSVITAPRITLFNGQRAYVIVATQRAYVKSLTINKSADGKSVGFEPEIGVASSGVILDARATASPDRKHATITLRPQLSTLVGMRDVPFPNSPPGENLLVQQPDVETSEIHTTLTIPDGQTVLLRGLRGSMAAGNNEPPAIRNVLLLVKPKIIVQREEDRLAPQPDPPRGKVMPQPATRPRQADAGGNADEGEEGTLKVEVRSSPRARGGHLEPFPAAGGRSMSVSYSPAGRACSGSPDFFSFASAAITRRSRSRPAVSLVFSHISASISCAVMS